MFFFLIGISSSSNTFKKKLPLSQYITFIIYQMTEYIGMFSRSIKFTYAHILTFVTIYWDFSIYRISATYVV